MCLVADPWQALSVATVGQSLALQSPVCWKVLRDRGAQITFAAAADAWVPCLRREGAFRPLTASRGALSGAHLAYWYEVNRLLREHTWDLVQIQAPISGALTRLAPNLRLARKVLYVAHGFHFHRDATKVTNFAVSQLEKVLAKRCDAVAVVSKEDFEDARLLNFDDFTVLWHLPGAGVDMNRFSTRSRPIPNLPEGYALFCGDFIERKNPLLAVDAVTLVNKRGRPLPLVMIGSGPLLPRVEARAAWLADRGYFMHIPMTDKVAEYMAGAGIHLLPAWQEGLPRVVMEAMASGVYTIATSNRGTRELLAAGGGSLMARSSSAQDWAAAIESSISRPVPSHVIDFVIRNYSLSAFSASYSALLDALGVPG